MDFGSESETEYILVHSIAAARISRHMTQKKFAEATGIDQSDISRIETGNGIPALSALARLDEGMSTHNAR